MRPVLVALCMLVAYCGLMLAACEPPPPTHGKQVEVIHEDDPRWDCHTMGNRVCGKGH
jgi:hypothetical protein